MDALTISILKLAAMINLMEEKARASLRKKVMISPNKDVIFAEKDVVDQAIILGIRSVREMLQGHIPTPPNFNGFLIVQDQKKIIGRITRDGAFEEIMAPSLKVKLEDLVVDQVLSRADQVIDSPKKAQKSAHQVIAFTHVVKWAEERVGK